MVIRAGSGDQKIPFLGRAGWIRDGQGESADNARVNDVESDGKGAKSPLASGPEAGLSTGDTLSVAERGGRWRKSSAARCPVGPQGRVERRVGKEMGAGRRWRGEPVGEGGEDGACVRVSEPYHACRPLRGLYIYIERAFTRGAELEVGL